MTLQAYLLNPLLRCLRQARIVLGRGGALAARRASTLQANPINTLHALSAPGSHVLDEAERSLHDALCVLAATVKDKRVVLGGGFPEMAMARVVRGTSRPGLIWDFGV